MLMIDIIGSDIFEIVMVLGDVFDLALLVLILKLTGDFDSEVFISVLEVIEGQTRSMVKSISFGALLVVLDLE
jgi:hypothetical protein